MSLALINFYFQGLVSIFIYPCSSYFYLKIPIKQTFPDNALQQYSCLQNYLQIREWSARMLAGAVLENCLGIHQLVIAVAALERPGQLQWVACFSIQQSSLQWRGSSSSCSMREAREMWLARVRGSPVGQNFFLHLSKAHIRGEKPPTLGMAAFH